MVAASRVTGLVGVVGPQFRGSNSAMLRGALDALLDELGAETDPSAAALGVSVGKRVYAEALRAKAKLPNERSGEEEILGGAMRAWLAHVEKE